MELSERNATVTWSLREELLLAFAVKRHGLKNWETVAMELQSRSNGFLFTAGICKEKYLNLRKRFVNHNLSGGGAAGGVGGGGDDNNDVLESDGGGEGEEEKKKEEEEEEFGWLEELRKLRVAELKMEVQRYDLSIESLKMKMKTMEEEGDKSLNREAKMADLDEEKEAEGSENDKKIGGKAKSAEVAGISGSGEDVNRSFNESNSTENTRTGLTNEPKPVEIKPSNSTLKPVEEDSCNDSSDSKEREKDRVNPAELVNSSSESRQGSHGTKGSSGDMQSSASQMTRRNKRKSTKARNGGGGGGVKAVPATVALKKGHGGGGGGKPEPIFGVLDAIRSHKHGGVFQRRLEIQKSRKYNNIIRRHVDLEMVQNRIENGSYSSCPAKIYVDLLLLYNNAIVFFPKSSSQARVAHQLRQVVMNHLKKHSPPNLPPTPDPSTRPERSNPLLAKQKSTAPIVVCKKRSNISSKPSSSSVIKMEKQAQKKPDSNPKPSINQSTLSSSNEEDGATKSKANEKPVTGVRSVRKGINVRPRLSPPPPRNLSEKPESSKASKEKAAATVEVNTIDKKKGAANFLKRIKKNEQPAQEASRKKDQLIKKTDDVGRSGGGGVKRVKDESSIKTSSDQAVQTTTTRRIGRPPKKGKEVLKGKRDRDGEEEEGSLKRPTKRSRR